MTADSSPATRPTVSRSPQRSRITNGSDLLPTTDGRSFHARLFRDLCDSLA